MTKKTENKKATRLRIGANIRWIRLLAGDNLAVFAQKIGINGKVPADSLSGYEKGRSQPNKLVLSRIAKIANITLQQLETTDLSKMDINVVNPDTKEMEFKLTTGKETEQVKDLEKKLEETKKQKSELEMEALKLRAENNLLKELVSKQLEKS